MVLQIKHTPYGVDRHVSSNAGPYNDTDLFPIMRHMGFSLPPDNHLLFTAPDDTEDDILAAGVIVLMLTE